MATAPRLRLCGCVHCDSAGRHGLSAPLRGTPGLVLRDADASIGGHGLTDAGASGPIPTVTKLRPRRGLNAAYFLCRKLYFLLRGTGIFNINKLFDFHELAAKINLGLQQCTGGDPCRNGAGLAIAADYKAI